MKEFNIIKRWKHGFVFRLSFIKNHNNELENLFNFSLWFGEPNTSKKTGSYEIFVFRNRGEEGVKMYKFEIGKTIGAKQLKRNFKLAPYDVVFIMESKTSKKKNRKLI